MLQISTDLDPLNLLRVLKKVERATGRTKTFTNGPRVVDLDLLFHDDQVVRVGERGDKEDEGGVGWLEIPHWAIAEREFVLRPLNEYVSCTFDVSPFLQPTLFILRLPMNLVAPLLCGVFISGHGRRC